MEVEYEGARKRERETEVESEPRFGRVGMKKRCFVFGHCDWIYSQVNPR